MKAMMLGGLAAIMLLTGLPAIARSIDWQVYRDADLAISLPMGLFEADDDGERGDGQYARSLYSKELDAALRVASGPIPQGASLAAIAGRLEEADWIRQVTYRAGGRRWLVMSGYAGAQQDQNLIFYAKFLANRDFTRFAFFEISYPRIHKRALDPVVTKIEKSLRTY